MAQLRRVLGIIDETAVTAKRAQEEAEQVRSAYVEASQGSADHLMRQAVTDSRTAADKAGKTARLLSEAAEHFTTYVNVIAPGSVPPRSAAPEAMPDGERTVTEAMVRRNRATSFLDRAARRADDVKDAAAETTKAVEEGTKVALRQIKGDRGASSGGPASTTTTTTHPAPSQPPPAHETVSAITVSVLGAALVGRAAVDYIKRRRNRRNQDDGQK
ncbi:hypothetical protein I0C86_00455 [Plantactinospora sp. S1510]|uniref:Uncharacterized protein n=1 Tax=Plantactinospora alkalitolerans TaxID=2789879 RepID=A0ABS0GMQ3_9ACTN|nr:hypothetical protein [Plantactinospora alkalitolerans]